MMAEAQGSVLRETLIGKKVVDVKKGDASIVLIFDDGTTFGVCVKSGPGADSNWYNWVAILLNDASVLELDL